MDKPKTALLVLDVQNSIISNLGDQATAYVQRVRQAVEAAHRAKLPVLFIVVRFRKGYPEVNPNNKMFATIRERQPDLSMDETNPATQPVIMPEAGDLVVAKKRVSAFAGSDLEMILRAQGIQRLVLCGVATSMVVFGTFRQALDMDFSLTVLSDGCLDHDEEVQRVLMEKVFPCQAEVLTIAEWAKGLGQKDD